MQALNLCNIPVGTPLSSMLIVYSDDTSDIDEDSTSSDDEYDIQPVQAARLSPLLQIDSSSDEDSEDSSSSSEEEETSLSDDELTARILEEQANHPIQDTSSSSDWDTSEDEDFSEELTEEFSSSYSEHEQPANGASCVGEPAGSTARVSATAACMLCTIVNAISRPSCFINTWLGEIVTRLHAVSITQLRYRMQQLSKTVLAVWHWLCTMLVNCFGSLPTAFTHCLQANHAH